MHLFYFVLNNLFYFYQRIIKQISNKPGNIFYVMDKEIFKSLKSYLTLLQTIIVSNTLLITQNHKLTIKLISGLFFVFMNHSYDYILQFKYF